VPEQPQATGTLAVKVIRVAPAPVEPEEVGDEDR
jgi:hypothetical protein